MHAGEGNSTAEGIESICIADGVSFAGEGAIIVAEFPAGDQNFLHFSLKQHCFVNRPACPAGLADAYQRKSTWCVRVRNNLATKPGQEAQGRKWRKWRKFWSEKWRKCRKWRKWRN